MTRTYRVFSVCTAFMLVAWSPYEASAANADVAKLCQKGGWTKVVRADGTAFANQDACTSYGARGGKFGQTITFTTTNPSSVTVGGATYTPRAAASSGLPVTISLDVTSTGCSLSSGIVSFIAGGTCVIDAVQAGDTLWAAAAQKQQTITVVRKSQTITFTSSNPSPVTPGGATYTPAASATSGLPVTISLDGASTGCSLASGVVSFSSAGTCVIDANQAGNGVWAAATQVQQSITISKSPQTITLTSTNPSPAVAGESYTPSATASSGLAVAFTLDGTSSGCSLTSGVVAFTAVGTCVIDANQSGNTQWTAAPQVKQSISIDACISTDSQLRRVAAGGGSYCVTGVALTSGEVVVGSTLSLTASGQTNATIDAQQNSRVFRVAPGGRLTLTDITVTGGRTGLEGGGISVGASLSDDTHGEVTLKGHTSVTGNVAWQGGGIYLHWGTLLGGVLTMNDSSTVTANRSTPPRAGVSSAFGGGVAVESTATLTMNDTSSISNNSVEGALISGWGGGLLLIGGNATLNDSASIANNRSLTSISGGDSSGAGIYLLDGSLTLTGTSAITGNSAATSGGGIYRGTEKGSFGGVTATNVAGNSPNNCAGTVAVPGCVN